MTAQKPYVLVQGWQALPSAWALAVVTPCGRSLPVSGWEPVNTVHCPRMQEHTGEGLKSSCFPEPCLPTPDIEHHREMVLSRVTVQNDRNSQTARKVGWFFTLDANYWVGVSQDGEALWAEVCSSCTRELYVPESPKT